MNGILVRASDGLVVVDVQNDFVSGSLAIPGSEAIIPIINRMMQRFRLIVLAQDWHPAGHISFASAHPGTRHGDTVAVAYGTQRVFHDHCVQGTEGAAFDPRLDTNRASLIVRKGEQRIVDSFSAFCENDRTTSTGLAELLAARGISRVFCAGLARYGYVQATAEDARRLGFEVLIVDDASAGRPTDDAPARDAALAAKGIGWVSSEQLT